MRTIRPFAMSAGLCLGPLAPGAATPADLAPGFYPGGAELSIDNRVAYQAFLERNKAKIGQIGLSIVVIRANPQAKGCIGAPVIACIASMAQTMPVGSHFAADPRYHALNAPLAGARRKALTIAFARLAALRATAL